MKKILLIAYNFPPAGGAQGLRWVQFIKYLVREGYEVDVLTIIPERTFGCYDESSLNMVSEKVKVIRSYAGPLYSLIHRYTPYIPPNKMTWKEDNKVFPFRTILRQKIKLLYKKIIKPIFIPDETIVWLPWGLKELRKLRKNEYRLIISSAPTFTCHILGYFFKKWTGTPWIMDYGDPWVFNPSFYNWRYPIDTKIERKFLKKADHILVTTDAAVDGFIKHYPFLKEERFTVISQGYDLEQFKKIKPIKGKVFRIVNTGSLYDTIREPYTFFDSIKQLNDIEMEVIIAGNVEPQQVKAGTDKDLKGKIVFLGHKSYEEALALQIGADVLLFLSNNSPYQIPGKIFEYFGSCRLILGIQMIENDYAISLIRKHNRGFVVSNKARDIALTIRKIYALWQKGELEKQFPLEYIKEYTWEYQAMKLKEIIDNVIEESKR